MQMKQCLLPGTGELMRSEEGPGWDPEQSKAPEGSEPLGLLSQFQTGQLRGGPREGDTGDRGLPRPGVLGYGPGKVWVLTAWVGQK